MNNMLENGKDKGEVGRWEGVRWEHRECLEEKESEKEHGQKWRKGRKEEEDDNDDGMKKKKKEKKEEK